METPSQSFHKLPESWEHGELSERGEDVQVPRSRGFTTAFLCRCHSFSSCLLCVWGGGGAGAWTLELHLEPLHQPFFVMNFFEIGSRELFAQAGFELRSSWVVRITGVSHQRPALPCLLSCLLVLIHLFILILMNNKSIGDGEFFSAFLHFVWDVFII
jgi:hypothetical protein